MTRYDPTTMLNGAQEQYEQRLIDQGMTPDAARQYRERHADRFVVDGSGIVRVLDRDGRFLPSSIADPVAHLARTTFVQAGRAEKHPPRPPTEEQLAAKRREFGGI